MGAWDKVLENPHENQLHDVYVVEHVMKSVRERQYSEYIISQGITNTKNIQSKTNRAIGIIIKISSTLYERPYGRHIFKAALPMRKSLLLGSMLSNCESWINITKAD